MSLFYPYNPKTGERQEQEVLKPTPEIPNHKPIIKPLPVTKEDLKPKKKKSKLIFIIGIIIGILLCFTFVSFTDYYVSNKAHTQELVSSYNAGVLYIINYTLTNKQMPYFDNGELKYISCGGAN